MLSWRGQNQGRLIAREEICRVQGSNLRPTRYECVALPTELTRQLLPNGSNYQSIRTTCIWNGFSESSL